MKIVTTSDVKFLKHCIAAFSLNVATSAKSAPVLLTAHSDHLIQSEVQLVFDSSVSEQPLREAQLSSAPGVQW